MTINYENHSITLTQDAFMSSDTRFNYTPDFPFGAYEASGYDTATGESCTVVWEALSADDGEDNADWNNPTTVLWHNFTHNDFQA